MAINIKFGNFTLRPSSPDDRDYLYRPKQTEPRAKVDLREWDSPVEDQSDLGSCVANAITNCYELTVNRLYPETSKQLSRLFVYYNGRLLEGSTTMDQGVEIRSALKAGAHFGLCNEDLWPYDISKFSVKPTPVCYRDGSYRVIPKYEKLGNLQNIINAVNDNKPVVAGMNIYKDFLKLDKDNYTLTTPEYYWDKLGYHAMAIVGYDLDMKYLIAKNSFGTDWGLDGYCQIPFDYANTQMFEQWVFDVAVPEGLITS